MKDKWFKKGYKPPLFDEKEDGNLDDVEAVFGDSEVSLLSNMPSDQLLFWSPESLIKIVSQQEFHVTEKKEDQPPAMNAFELIAMSKGLNLGNLFDAEQVITHFYLFNLSKNYMLISITVKAYSFVSCCM